MKLTIEAIPRTKKNSQEIVKVKSKGRWFYKIIPSKYYRQFEEECKILIQKQYKREIDYPVNIKAIFYMKERRRIDLVNLLEGLDDMLVTTKVLADDNRDIIAGHDGSRVYYDKERPRIEITITKEEGYETWRKRT